MKEINIRTSGDVNTKLECIVIKRKGAGRQKGMGKGEKQKRKLQGSNATPSCMYLVKYYNA